MCSKNQEGWNFSIIWLFTLLLMMIVELKNVKCQGKINKLRRWSIIFNDDVTITFKKA